MDSDPERVVKNARRYFGMDVPIYISTRPKKKFMIQRPDGKFIHFGEKGYQDFTAHLDKTRQLNYTNRASNIKGDWRDDPFSPNNLSLAILWEYGI